MNYLKIKMEIYSKLKLEVTEIDKIFILKLKIFNYGHMI